MLGLFARPQPVTLPIVLLFSIIPFYLVIGEVVSGAILHAPELPLDRALPVQAGWSVVYLSLYLAALLPVFVVHQQELIRRTVLAFLSAWLVAYAFFLAYPTVAPTRVAVVGVGFVAGTRTPPRAAVGAGRCGCLRSAGRHPLCDISAER